MMCRASTEQDDAMPHLSALAPKPAMTDAATGDSYPVREHEALERHPRPRVEVTHAGHDSDSPPIVCSGCATALKPSALTRTRH